MATNAANKRYWNEEYDWPQGGEVWSSSWGDSSAQWYWSILPRIRPFIPAGSILEIAPGFGRWTTFLKNLCDEMQVVDIADRCIETCRRRFAADTHLRYHVNDGSSLHMICDDSIDFAFSFDSLVHVEADAIRAYLSELSRKLTRDGVAFLHHSNMAEHASYFERVSRLGRARPFLARLGVVEATGHGRARSMSAKTFVEYSKDAGLECVTQELVNWICSPSHLIDCFSVVTRRESRHYRPLRQIRNPRFMSEAKHICSLSKAARRLESLYQS